MDLLSSFFCTCPHSFLSRFFERGHSPLVHTLPHHCHLELLQSDCALHHKTRMTPRQGQFHFIKPDGHSTTTILLKSTCDTIKEHCLHVASGKPRSCFPCRTGRSLSVSPDSFPCPGPWHFMRTQLPMSLLFVDTNLRDPLVRSPGPTFHPPAQVAKHA